MGATSRQPARAWSARGVWTLAVATVRAAQGDRLVGLSAEVAFFALLSLPPALLALFGSLGFVADLIGPQVTQDLVDEVLGTASTIFSASTVNTLEELIDSVLEHGRGGVIAAGIVLALWSASRATRVCMDTVKIAYDLPIVRSGWRRRLTALGVTVLGILAAVILLPLIVLGPRLGEWLGLGEVFATPWAIVYWPTVLVCGVGLLATFYHYSTPWSTPWRRDIPGAVLAAVAWILGGVGVRVYAAVTIAPGDNGTVFGPLAVPVVLLLWLYVTAFAVLLGAELNSQIERHWPTTGYVRALDEARSEGDTSAAGR